MFGQPMPQIGAPTSILQGRRFLVRMATGPAFRLAAGPSQADRFNARQCGPWCQPL